MPIAYALCVQTIVAPNSATIVSKIALYAIAPPVGRVAKDTLSSIKLIVLALPVS